MSPAANPVVQSVYLLDDLSDRIRERAHSAGLGPSETSTLLAAARRTTLEAAAAFPLGEVSVDLITWEHVTESLRVRLGSLPAPSVTAETLVLGDGGARLASIIEAWGIRLPGRVEIPVAKVLEDPANAFYSPHHIRQRDRKPLAVGTVSNAGELIVVDDCVQTGMTFDAVAAATGARSGSIITGICNEATLGRLRADGWTVHYGVLLPGPTYPDSYSTDLFCVRDFVVTDAVRFADGSSTSYSSGGDWLELLYGDPQAAETVRAAWMELAELLAGAGVEV
ncbi:hypothetical protein QLQ12_37530 [Actinoplanes sp. NEAU-A12]|uniref:Phosphoribosyltransferase n=1 Tax=Actinoplanes sandaracinus TaxID=3045177 RepID=A0ABT6WX49_9ACTN|nr:hypothetical protein [Actinoplanes sandaracinus]MDI6104310.1 hypothetical protein [Actinoplanes sandaracinus]